MKIVHILGHNHNWNIEAFNDQGVGDEFLISAFSFGQNFNEDKRISLLLENEVNCMIDLQFYGQKESRQVNKGKLKTFEFHPANIDNNNLATNEALFSCIKNAINFQIKCGFKKIIIPNYYDNDNIYNLTTLIESINKYLEKNRHLGIEYYMTIPFSYDIIRDRDNIYIERILSLLTDMSISFDGYYIVSENKPESFKKITVDSGVITNLSRVFKTLKNQDFKIIYSFANWDAIIYLAQCDIDYITIGTYENLRSFSISRYTQDVSGGKSDGYYFSEVLLNMVKAKDLANIRLHSAINLIRNRDNIFSDIILNRDYIWSIHKPDVNKNYLIAISRLLNKISDISDIHQRTLYVLLLINNAINQYDNLNDKYVTLQGESQNYHLNVWRNQLLKSLNIRQEVFNEMLPSLRKQYSF